MRLILSEALVMRDPPAFDLPGDISVAVYFHGDYGSVNFHGVTPAQLHDAIGCPKADAYRELEEAARPIYEGAKATRNSDWLCPHGNRSSYPTHAWWCDRCFFRFEAALTALALAAVGGRKPCADCDSGAEDIPPHDCPNLAREAAR